MFRKKSEDIKTQKITDEIKTCIRKILRDFTFKGGDSDYSGFHFDGKSDKGTRFSIEQMRPSGDSDVTPYFVDVFVSGPNQQDIEEVHKKIVNCLTQTDSCMSEKVIYILDAVGKTGYCFDPLKKEVRMRRDRIETILEAGSEEMVWANDSRTGQTIGFGTGESGEEITEEEYNRL